MVSITVSVPQEIKVEMNRFPEMNWSGFVKKAIEEKVKRLEKIEALKTQVEKEQDVIDWSVKLQRASRSGRLEQLRKKGLI